MGNRAVITTEDKKMGIYLHWNGGRDSVKAFLKYCKDMNFRKPEVDGCGWARLCQVIANYFGDSGLCVGIDILENLDFDNGNNGLYIIKDWAIIGREFFKGKEQKNHKQKDLLLEIDKVNFCIYKENLKDKLKC